MNKSNICIVIALLLMVMGMAPDAPAKTKLVPGSRIRLVAPVLAADTIVGRYRSHRPDTIFLITDGVAAKVAIPFDAIERFEVYRPADTTGLNFSSAGFIGGMLAGSIIGGRWLVSDEMGYGPNERLGRNLFFAAAGGLLGGFVLGELTQPGARWEEVSLDRVEFTMDFYRGREKKLFVSFTF